MTVHRQPRRIPRRLSRRRRPARRSQGTAIPHDRPRHQPTDAHGPAAGERLCDDPPARRGGRYRTKLGNHSFRATGITAYLKNGGTLEKAAAMANHASTRTTQLYDRRRDEVSLDEVERIVI
jgi:integrase